MAVSEITSKRLSLRSHTEQMFRFLSKELHRNPVITVLLEIFSPRHGARAMTAFFHRATCLNQGWIIEYSFLLSRKHRDLKNAKSTIKNKNKEIKDALDKLDYYAGNKFFEATSNNFDLLNEYFQNKYSDSPRVCVKGNLLRGHSSLVVSVFRREPVDYSARYEISSNSGFEHCFTTGRYYLENDLPGAVNMGHYNNPRINYHHVREVQDLGLIGRRQALYENWSYIWKDGSSSKGDHYKSTLIVPMTILNAQLSDDFLKKFGDGSADRFIFGFLCFDHHEVDYFDQEDVDTAYFFADFISLYAYNLLNFTTYSETYKSASSKTDHHSESSIFEVEEKLIARPFKSSPTYEFRTTAKKSSKNVLVYFEKNDGQ